MVPEKFYKTTVQVDNFQKAEKYLVILLLVQRIINMKESVLININAKVFSCQHEFVYVVTFPASAYPPESPFQS